MYSISNTIMMTVINTILYDLSNAEITYTSKINNDLNM